MATKEEINKSAVSASIPSASSQAASSSMSVSVSIPSASSQAASSSMSVSSTLPKFTRNDAIEFLSKWSEIIDRVIICVRSEINNSRTALDSFSLDHLCIDDPFIVKLCDKLYDDPCNVCVAFLPVGIAKWVNNFVYVPRMLSYEHNELKNKCTFILRVCLSCLITPPREDVVPCVFSDEISRFAEYYTSHHTPSFLFKSSVHSKMYSRLIVMLHDKHMHKHKNTIPSDREMRELWHMAISDW